jgi:hypothetical protein
MPAVRTAPTSSKRIPARAAPVIEAFRVLTCCAVQHVVCSHARKHHLQGC